jgi:hypothetical protein
MRRNSALLALLGLFAFVGATAIGLAAGNTEGCFGCNDCATGLCGPEEQSPFDHHHCCAASCMSHSSFALPISVATPLRVMERPIDDSSHAAPLAPTPEPPYIPPRA